MAETKDSDSPLSVGETGELRKSIWNEINLSVWRWAPKTTESVRALVYIAHGVAEYMGRYRELANVLSENSIIVFGHDHVGHGNSGGEKVFIEDFNTYVHDVINHVKEYKESHPGIPCFLLGHSMGGLIAAIVAKEEKDLFAGVVFSAAGLDTYKTCCEKILARVLGGLFPHCGVETIDTSLISSIPEEVERYVNDPLVYKGKLKAKWAAEFLNTILIARRGIKKIKIPALILHGSSDGIVPLDASLFIYNNIGTPDKDLKYEVFDDNFHEVLHDKGQERARNMIKDWIIGNLEQ